MKAWPVPESFSRILPQSGQRGSFWEDRGDRFHCGVDIYSPENSRVVAVESGTVVDTGIFTSPKMIPYWNTTYYIVIKHYNGLLSKYAELAGTSASSGEEVDAGQVIGYVGGVLDLDKITDEAPLYVQELKRNGLSSMLHFELFESEPITISQYLGGNTFADTRPSNLLDATFWLP